MVEFGVGVIDRYPAFERFVDLHFGPGKAEAFRLGRDLERAALPLHDVVVADAAFVYEAADAVEVFWGGAPGGFCFARGAAEAAVVVGQEAAQDRIGTITMRPLGDRIIGPRQAGNMPFTYSCFQRISL